MARTDIHRPSAIIPADYSFVDHFGWVHISDCDESHSEPYGEHAMADYEDGPHADTPWAGKLDRCDVCGAHFLHGAVFKHNPTGHMLSMGGDCADLYLNLRALPRTQRASRVAPGTRRRMNAKKARGWLQRHPEVAKALATNHHITRDLVRSLLKYSSLTEKQQELAIKLQADHARYLERKAAREAEEANTNWIQVPTGRIAMQGRVLHTKFQESMYGISVKMLVKVDTDEGSFKVWGTIPSAIDIDDLKGHTVSFTAAVEPSNDDPHFGFYKRPTKAKVIEA